MISTNLLQNTANHKIVAEKGRFYLLEYELNRSVTKETASEAFFASRMGIRKKQVIINLNNDGGVIIQAGAMQLMIGQIEAKTNVKGVGDFMKKFFGSKATGESAVKPLYAGNGLLVLEPTYKFILLESLANWKGAMVIEDGMFLACDDSVNLSITRRTTISSAVLGKEGLFNTALSGEGIVALESPVPAEDLFVIDLEDDVVKIDGDMAIAWSNSLDFTVERTTKTLIGSAASGEGLVNVYRGTGRVLIAPVT